MNRADVEEQDELVASLLVAYDEALVDDALRPDVESLVDDRALAARLRDARECLELLDRVRRLDSQTATSPATRDFETPSINDRTRASYPQRIGRFEIVRELGRGGLGVVLLGRDPELGRHVAIKIPRADLLAGGELERRFLREAEAAARLSHPHLVPLYEVGRDGPLCYLVSEYCTGPTLAAWLKTERGSLPPQQAATLVRQLAEAVHHAHSRGVLHRDIKPSNVMLEGRLEAGGGRLEEGHDSASLQPSASRLPPVPKLTDFGMAKILESSGDETRTGAVIGTPAYMAPEQADGRMREIDARTDVYALGAVLYELLTGQAPYRGASDVDMLRQLLLEEPAAPRTIRPAVPRDLEAITLKCLAKQPHARYPTAQHLAEDLARFLAGQPTLARPLGPGARLAKWARRRPTTAALASVSAVAAVALLATVIVYNARLSAEATRAEREADASRRLLYSADVRLAHEALRANNVEQMRELLARHVPAAGQEDLRDFAWHYLHGLCKQEALSLVGHGDEVFAVAFSPDGRTLATASKDRTARLWDVGTGKVRHVLSGHADEVTRVAFSPDGRLLATASEDRTVRLWDVTSGGLQGALEGHTDHLLAVAFSPDGRRLASGSFDTTVRVWNVEGRVVERVLDSPADYVQAVAFSPDGSMLVAGDDTGAVHCWGTADWRELAGASNPSTTVLALAFSPDLPLVATAGKDHGIRLWQWSEKGLEAASTLEHGHKEKLQSLAFSPLDSTLASCAKDGLINVHLLNQRDDTRTIIGHAGRVWSVAFSPDGRLLASAGADRTVKIWDLARSGVTADLFPSVSRPIHALDITPDATRLVTGSRDGCVRVWDLAERRLLSVHQRHDGEVALVHVSPDGKRMASGGYDDHLVKIGVLGADETQLVIPSDVGSSQTMAWSPDGRRVAFRQESTTVAVADARSGEVVSRLSFDYIPYQVEFSPGGESLAIVTDRARLYDPASGAVTLTLGEADCLAFSPDGTRVATGRLTDVTIWDALSGAALRVLPGRTGEVKSLRFSPDGKTLAALVSSAPGVIHMWRAGSGQELLELTAPRNAKLADFLFTPEGEGLIAVGWEGSRGRIWEWSAIREEANVASPVAPASASPFIAAEDAIPLRRESELLVEFEPRAAAGRELRPLRVRCQAFDGSRSEITAAASLHPVPAFGARQLLANEITQPLKIATHDFDRDGDVDVAVASHRDRRLYFCENEENGSFSGNAQRRAIQGIANLHLADVDGDRAMDLVFASDNGVGWMTFDAKGTKSEPAIVSDALKRTEQVATADLDGDGDLDFACASRDDSRISTIENLGGGSYAAPKTISVDLASVISVVAADLDADGDCDIAAASLADGKLAWYANDGRGQFPAEEIITTEAAGVEVVIPADLDADGNCDLVHVGDDTAAWHANDGHGHFAAPQALATDLDRALAADVADLDGDGDLDVLVTEYTGRVQSFLNDGRGLFQRPVRPVDSLAARCEGVKAADLNGDGRLDVIITVRGKDQIVWCPSEGLRFDVKSEADDSEHSSTPWPRAGVLRLSRTPQPRDKPRRQLTSVTVRFESPQGEPLTAGEVQAAIERVSIYRDANASGALEPRLDPVVGTAPAAALADGTLTVPLEPHPAPAASPLPPVTATPTSCQLIRAVNAWAVKHGYAGGYPTFVPDHHNGRWTLLAVLFRPQAAKVISVPQALLARDQAPPRSDYDDPQRMLADIADRLNSWAWKRGYAGALFTAQVAPAPAGETAYQALLLRAPDQPQVGWTLDDLGQPESYEALCRAVHQRAQAEDHLSGYPSFYWGRAMECVMIDAPLAELVEIPLDELRPSP